MGLIGCVGAVFNHFDCTPLRLRAPSPLYFYISNSCIIDIFLWILQEIPSRNLGGRPVGSTIPEKKKKKDDFIRMMNEIAEKNGELKHTYLKLPNANTARMVLI